MKILDGPIPKWKQLLIKALYQYGDARTAKLGPNPVAWTALTLASDLKSGVPLLAALKGSGTNNRVQAHRLDYPVSNTDKELWRERPGDFFADSLHVTTGGAIGLNCRGHVIVAPLRSWHAAGELFLCVNPNLPRWRHRLAMRLLNWPLKTRPDSALCRNE